MKPVLYILIAIACLLALYFIGLIPEKNKEKRFIERLKKEYGQKPDKPYSAEREKALNGFYNYRIDDGKFFLDDSTWNDFEMNRIYKRINRAYSSCGDEVLYSILRKPNTEAFDVEKINSQIEFWQKNEDKRIETQVMFAKLGRTGRFSLYRYIELLDFCPKLSMIWIALLLLGYLLTIPFFFLNVSLGAIVLIVYIVFNFCFFIYRKNKIEPYIISFTYIIKLLQISMKLSSKLPDVYSGEAEEIKKLRFKLSSISSVSMFFISSDGVTALQDLASLAKTFIKIVTHIDLIFFYSMLKTVKEKADVIDRIFEIMGTIESHISIASFRDSVEFISVPEFVDNSSIETEEIFYPLVDKPVSNSITVHRGILLTGSNASGKSTFLRTIGINAILSQSICTACAKSYKADLFRVYSSMCIKDNPLNGESYYIVEIKSLKRLLEYSKEYPGKILMFVDEVLKGTNTIERISAGCEIIKSLAENNNLIFAATHDIELTRLLADVIDNYHFDEIIEKDDFSFTYKLLSGPARARNAIKLLKLFKYPEEIVSESSKRADYFVEKGEWEI